MIDSKSQKAVEKAEKAKLLGLSNFYGGLSCSESTYEALLRSGAVPPEQVSYTTCALCAGFGGGAGCSGNNCGALSGAIMAVGAVHGRKYPLDDKPDGLYELEYHRYNLLVDEFIRQTGSPLCKEICRDYLGKWSSPGRKACCAEVVQTAIYLACKYIDMESEEIRNMPWGYNVTEERADDES